MPLTDEEKTFQNPERYWEHDGAFSVELTKGTSTKRVPLCVRIDGNTAHVENGRIKETIGGIQLYGLPDHGAPFHFSYASMVCIRRGDGSLLWRNYHVK